MFSDRGGHQHVRELVHGADGLMRSDTRILKHRVALHARVKNIFHWAFDGFVHLRQRTVLGYVGHVSRIPRVLLVGVRVYRREEPPDAFRTLVKGPLAVRSARSVGEDGDVWYVVSRPALRLLVPPDNWFRARVGLASPVAGGSVIEDAHIVGPGPTEPRIETQASRIRLRVAALREVLAVGEDARVDPRA